MPLKEAILTGGRSLILPKRNIVYDIYLKVNACFGAHCFYKKFCLIFFRVLLLNTSYFVLYFLRKRRSFAWRKQHGYFHTS